jgi:hypothetical protein
VLPSNLQKGTFIMTVRLVVAAAALAIITVSGAAANAQGFPSLPPMIPGVAPSSPYAEARAPESEADDYARLSDADDYGPLGKPQPFTYGSALPQFARYGIAGRLTPRLSEKLNWLRWACEQSYNLAIQTDPDVIRDLKALDSNIRVAYYETRAFDPSVIGPEEIRCLHRVDDQEIATPNGAAPTPAGPEPSQQGRVVSLDGSAGALYVTNTVAQLLANPTTRAILARDVPEVVGYRDQAAIRNLPLNRAIAVFFQGQVDHSRLKTLEHDLVHAEPNNTPAAGSQQGKVVHF